MTHSDRASVRQQIAEYCRDHTAPEAARLFGVSKTTIQRACSEYRVTCRRSHKIRGEE